MAQPKNPRDESAPDATPKPKRDRSTKAGARPSATDVPVNAIAFGTERSGGIASGGTLAVERAAKANDAKRRTTTKKMRDEPPAKSSSLKARSQPIPEAVKERFIQIGSSFFFPDGAEAFTDDGNRVTTRSENAIVIQSMVAIAMARAAGPVTVTGTDFFKKEAWFAARLAGLDVLGYEPTALEQERLVRAIARRRTAEGTPQSSSTAGTRENGKLEPLRSDPSPNAREGSPAEGELIVGRLVDHGSAPYQHKPNQPMSYYVRIETDRGDREIWGVDLERAFRKSLSTPGVGDEVGLRAIGRDPVTVLAPKYDPAGREVGREELDTHRNQWLVERKDFLDRRFKMADLFRNASVSAPEAIKQHPELEGSYLQLQIARAGTEQRIQNREAREQFIDHLRAHLAKTIEYGQPLEPVRLKARGKPAPDPERVRDRDYMPTR
jgi:putative DNA primase/helicase